MNRSTSMPTLAPRHLLTRAVPALLILTACSRATEVRTPPPATPARTVTAAAQASSVLERSEQAVVVLTPGWDTTAAVLQRYERDTPAAAWRVVGAGIPAVVGRTGLAWGDEFAERGARVKREGDGRAPAGIFPLQRLFGFVARGGVPWARMPYLALTEGTECVDDPASTRYNTIVDRASVAQPDWTSAERMRRIEQYRLGVLVGYNDPPRAGRGSCIFLHVWAGPGTFTAGCTAMAERDLAELAVWLDARRAPVLVQLPAREYARRRAAWKLP